eukprot:4456064-Prymnesium_polylepis.1
MRRCVRRCRLGPPSALRSASWTCASRFRSNAGSALGSSSLNSAAKRSTSSMGSAGATGSVAARLVVAVTGWLPKAGS